jgi:hypothetical protein
MSMPSKRIRPFAMSMVIAALVAIIGARSLAQRPKPPAGVVIITLDTTRADRLAAYGFMSGSTPAIDRLARSGVVFEQATMPICR